MPIDPKSVQWDAPDPSQVQWDDKPDFSNVRGGVKSSPGKPKPKAAVYNRGFSPVAQFMGGALDGLQHHAANIPVAIAQAGANTGDWLGNALRGPRAPSMSELVAGKKQSFADRVNAFVRDREANYQQRTDESQSSRAGSFVGGAAGEILPWVTGIGALRGAGMLPKVSATGAKGVVQKAGLLAAEGAAMGAAQPVVGEGGYGAQKGAQVAVGAAAAPLLAGSMSAVGRGARYVTPGGRDAIANERIARMYGANPETLAALRQESGIPGYQHTVAQQLATPEAVQAERMLRNQGNTAPAFASREAANNAALRAEAERLAGDDAAMQAAKQARTEATAPYYASLEGQRVDPASVLAQLDQLQASSLGVRPNIKGAAGSLRAEIESRLGPDGKIDASILSGLRENIGSHLGPMSSGQEKRALVPVKDTIADALDRAVPGYRDSLAAYARLSQPISDMEAGRTLLGAIDSGGRDAGGNQAVSLTQLKTMLSKDARSRYPMSKEARARAEAMLDALQRRSVTNNTIAASGPGTAADSFRGAAASPMGQRMGSGLVAMLGGAAGGLDGGLLALLASETAQGANNSVMRRVGTKAADAGLTAQAIEAYRRSQNPALSYSPLLRMLPYETLP